MQSFKNLKQAWCVFVLCLVCSLSVSAQKQSVGYVYTDQLIPKMSLYKRAMSEIEQLQKNLEQELKIKQTNAQSYYKKVMDASQSYSPQQMQTEEAKLGKMQEDIQKFVTQSQKQIETKTNKLMTPIYKKVEKALTAVAQDKGYAYIFDSKLLLYRDGGIDATAFVKSKLGIK